MSLYPENIRKRLDSTQRARRRGSESACGSSASFVCGCFVRIQLQIDHSAQLVEEATFTSNGCGFAIAAADVVCDSISGRRLTDLHGSPAEIEQQCELVLGDFPEGRGHCLQLAVDALRSALADNRQRRIAEFQGEKALICTCFGIAEDTIVGLIARNGITEVEQISDLTNAGTGCGACRMLIRELIDSAELE